VFDWFRTASPNRQLQYALAGAAVLALVMIAVWYAFLRVTYLPLFGDLRPADASTIVSVLEKKKIPYKLADGGAVILVPEDMVDSTRLDVMSDDVPLKGTVGFELFNKSDMGLTDFAQKINYQRALQGELERTIMTLDGVDTARVHLSLGEDRLFRDDRVPPKASVTVRMAHGHKLSEDAAQGVKRLVAAAVPNLDIANVVILDEEGDVVSGQTIAPAAAASSPNGEERRAIEEYYESRIRQAIAHANPNAQVEVGVQAELPIDASGQAATTSLSGWTPAVRDFPLQVMLSPAAPLDPATQDAVKAVALGAITSTAAQNDVIAFGAATPVLPVLAAVPRAAVSPAAIRTPAEAPVSDDDHDMLIEAGIAGAVLMGIIFVFVLVFSRLRGPRRMSDRRREDFVAKLRATLQEGEAHAAP
jgi:flagellar M-ring protein FliF